MRKKLDRNDRYEQYHAYTVTDQLVATIYKYRHFAQPNQWFYSCYKVWDGFKCFEAKWLPNGTSLTKGVSDLDMATLPENILKMDIT